MGKAGRFRMPGARRSAVDFAWLRMAGIFLLLEIRAGRMRRCRGRQRVEALLVKEAVHSLNWLSGSCGESTPSSCSPTCRRRSCATSARSPEMLFLMLNMVTKRQMWLLERSCEGDAEVLLWFFLFLCWLVGPALVTVACFCLSHEPPTQSTSKTKQKQNKVTVLDILLSGTAEETRVTPKNGGCYIGWALTSALRTQRLS